MAGQNFSADLTFQVIHSLTLVVLVSSPWHGILLPASVCKHGWCEHVAGDHSTSSPALGGRELQLYRTWPQTCVSCCGTAHAMMAVPYTSPALEINRPGRWGILPGRFSLELRSLRAAFPLAVLTRMVLTVKTQHRLYLHLQRYLDLQLAWYNGGGFVTETVGAYDLVYFWGGKVVTSDWLCSSPISWIPVSSSSNLALSQLAWPYSTLCCEAKHGD